MSEQYTPPPEAPLESWKAIAAHLNRDVRTVMRWEQSEGLPVHRHQHLARSTVYAYPSELDAWRARRKPEPRTRAEGGRIGSRLIAIAAAVVTILSAGDGRFLGSVAASSAPQAIRQLWTGPKVDATGGMSRDGRWLSYSDGSGDVIVRDLLSGQERRLSGKLAPTDPEGQVYASRLSPDGSQVVIQWQQAKPQHASIRLIDVRFGRSARLLYENPEIGWIAPFDWSPDGRLLAMQLRQNTTAQIALLAAADGTLQILKTTTWSGSSGLFFSNDGRRLAYDLPVTEGSVNRDIHVIDVDGGREMTAINHQATDTVLGWTHDGTALLFASNRSGRTAFYAAAIVDGKSAAEPVLIKADVGRLRLSYGVRGSGQLIYVAQTTARTIETAEVDFTTGKLLSDVVRPMESYQWASREPVWSRDGKYLVYQLEKPEARSVIALREIRTGTTLEIVPALEEFIGVTSMPDGAISVLGSDARARRGFYRVDPIDGSARLLHQPRVLAGRTFGFSPDGLTLFYLDRSGNSTTIHASNLRSEDDRLVTTGGAFAISPDGRTIACFEASADGTSTLKTVSVTGEEPHVLHRFERGHRLLGVLRWTSGGRLVYGRWIDQRETPTAFAIPASGGVPVELDPRIPGHPTLAIHPDGRRVAFEAGGTSLEVWALENFLPSAKR